MSYKSFSLEDLLKSHRKMNDDIFRSLNEDNVALNLVKKIDFYFLAADADSLQNLAIVLRDDRKYEVKIYAQETEGGEEFSLQGICLDVPITRESMDDWVEKMVRLGAEFQSTFGGWGIEH